MQRHSWLKFRLFVLGAFALFGVALTGIRPIGLAVSQTCCVPFADGSGCPADSICAAAQLQQPSPVDPATTIVGIIVIAVSVALLVGEIRFARRKEEEARRRLRGQEFRVA